MADFRSPFVPDLPRFTGGAVGYLGYGAASWFEPVLGDLGGGVDGADRPASCCSTPCSRSITCSTAF